MSHEKSQRIVECLKQISEETGEESLDKIAYKWLLMHPAGIMPIVGSGKIERLKMAVNAFNVPLSLEHWFKIYVASEGEEMP